MKFWTTSRRGAVEIATYSNPPYNLVTKEVFDELEELVVACEDPAIRAVVIQADPQGVGFSSYSVEALYGIASDPALSRYSGALGRSQDTIVLRTYLIGGGFGRRLDGDYVVLRFKVGINNVRSNEARTTCKKNFHFVSPPGRTLCISKLATWPLP